MIFFQPSLIVAYDIFSTILDRQKFNKCNQIYDIFSTIIDSTYVKNIYFFNNP